MSRASPHPLIWMVLTLPWGLSAGFVLVTLSFLATQNGLSITESAVLTGALMLPWCLQAFWTPLVDRTLTYRRWFVIATSGLALLTFAMVTIPLSTRSFPAFLAMVTAMGVLDTVIYVAVPSMMKLTARPEQYGWASAWNQIGHMGGIGLGGGLSLFLLRTLPESWMAGLLFAVACMTCCLALPKLPPAQRMSGGGVFRAMKQVPLDLWKMIKTPAGFLCTLLGSLPFATGAAAPLLAQSSVAQLWGADAGTVELAQGILASLATSLGCLAGGWLSQRIAPRASFVCAALTLGLVSAILAIAPATPDVYVGGLLCYAFATGACFAAYVPVMLQAMDANALSSKIGFLGSLGFFPVWWVGLLMGRLADLHGVQVALLSEAGLAALSGLAFLAIIVMMRRRLSLN